LNHEREGSINKKSFGIIHASAAEERKTVFENKLYVDVSSDNVESSYGFNPSNNPFSPVLQSPVRKNTDNELDGDRYSDLIKKQDRLNDELDADRYSKLIKL